MEDARSRQVGYVELLRTYPTFAKYFFANILSTTGTWFTTIALFVLAAEVSGLPELAVGLVLVLRMFALAFPQPFTGMLADRYSRKGLMILSNIGSALCALSLLLVNGPEDVVLYYAMTVMLMVLHAVYVPAENAAIPNLVGEGEALMTANAMNSATWSIALAVGASVGGFVVAAYGTDTAFIIDAVSFSLSALFISLLTIPQETKEAEGSIFREGLAQIADGFRRILSTPPVYRILTAKALWSIGGGGLVFCLILVGEEIGMGEVAAGIGVLFAARGIGSGVGPIIARATLRDRKRWPFHLGFLVSLCGLFYVLVGLLSWTPWITILVLCAHASSGANWVLSTVMLQERTEDDWRGRVFATDFLLMTTANGTSSLVAALLITYGDVSLRQLVLAFAMVQVVSGILWVLITRKGEREYYLASTAQVRTPI